MNNFFSFINTTTNRLVLITVIIHLTLLALFANSYTGFELFHWNTENFKPWQLISHIFLHADHWHLAFNMFALWSFGNVLERAWGKYKFLYFYLICGVGAAIISQIINSYFFPSHIYAASVGASGAIYGLLAAFALKFPNFKIVLIFLPVPVAAKYFVPVLLLIDLSAGITGFSIFGANIAHFAHIGGAIFGLLITKFWLK